MFRWQRFAPGPVRAVTVTGGQQGSGQVHPKAEAKRRGRKRKNEEAVSARPMKAVLLWLCQVPAVMVRSCLKPSCLLAMSKESR